LICDNIIEQRLSEDFLRALFAFISIQFCVSNSNLHKEDIGKNMPITFLTREGYQTMQEELEHLRTTRRQEIANRLHEAMEGGELIENAEYEDAKNEQAFVEGRIKELEILLATARVITEEEKHENVQVGSKVTVQEEGGQPETYIIVGAAEANPRGGKISNESPLGKALINRKAGDLVKVEAPAGSFDVQLLKVE
jgi:transcription elongation factor GreA